MSDNTGIRIGKRRGFTLIYNDMLPEGEISARAWGVYCYLLSRPEGWECRVSHLRTVFKEGRDAIYTALRELVDVGLMGKEDYIENGLRRQRYVINGDGDDDLPTGPGNGPGGEKSKARTQAKSGTHSAPAASTETGSDAQNRRSAPETDSQDAGSPDAGNSDAGGPDTENTGGISTDSSITDSPNTEGTNAPVAEAASRPAAAAPRSVADAPAATANQQSEQPTLTGLDGGGEGDGKPAARDAADRLAHEWWEFYEANFGKVIKTGRSNPFIALRDKLIRPALDGGWTEYEIKVALRGRPDSSPDPVPNVTMFQRRLAEARTNGGVDQRRRPEQQFRSGSEAHRNKIMDAMGR